jgi:hypothetical protein
VGVLGGGFWFVGVVVFVGLVVWVFVLVWGCLCFGLLFCCEGLVFVGVMVGVVFWFLCWGFFGGCLFWLEVFLGFDKKSKFDMKNSEFR